MSKKEVVIISANLLDRETRATKIINTLTKNDYLVTFLCWNRGENNSRSERKEAGVFHKEIQLKFRAPWGIKILFFLPVWWTFIFLKLMLINWDIVHVIQVLSLPPVVLASKLKNKPVLYDLLDVYEDTVPLPKKVRDLCIRIDKIIMHLVDAVILADEEQIEEMGGVPNPRVVPIYDSPYTTYKITPSSSENKVFTIFYAGLLFSVKKLNLDKIIEAVKEIDNVVLVFAGYGDMAEEIKNLSLKFPEKIVYLGEITHAEVLERSMNADLLFVLRDPLVLVNKYTCGSKVLEAMMCGTPILVNKDTSTAKKIHKENCGIVVDAKDVSEIRSAIIKMRDDPELCRELSQNAKIAYDNRYSWTIMEQRLLNLYKEVGPK
ncbi:MAG: glycosyltransferase family 4 protein [Methanomethylovorans sp.]|uniref:glycosyltransferase family 4 protein n=1 Tax=Methanomethylovorans sp. TaxID=2758717 RepID=UPI00353118CE